MKRSNVNIKEIEKNIKHTWITEKNEMFEKNSTELQSLVQCKNIQNINKIKISYYKPEFNYIYEKILIKNLHKHGQTTIDLTDDTQTICLDIKITIAHNEKYNIFYVNGEHSIIKEEQNYKQNYYDANYDNDDSYDYESSINRNTISMKLTNDNNQLVIHKIIKTLAEYYGYINNKQMLISIAQ